MLFILRNFALLLLVVGSAQGAVIVTPQLERATIMSGETVALTISVQGGNPQSAENFAHVQGLTIQYRGTGQKITSINGQTTVEHVLNYGVTGSQPGQYTLPSIKIEVDGVSYSTHPLKLTVTKPDPTVQNRYAFLRLNVPKNEIYVGEIITIELQLYVTDAENLEPPQLKSDGFVIHKRVEHTSSRAQVGNVIYTVLTFPMTVSAAKAGKLALGPAEMNLVLRMRAQPDPTDFFGFGRYQRRPMTATSAPVELNVLPLPSPAPTNFTGAIGTFQWTVSAAPTNVNSGEPITIRTVIGGRGNFDNVKLPELNWPNFRAYTPNSTAAPRDQLGLEGSRTFEQVVVPQSDSVTEIPALSFAYFDPEKKSFATLRHSATPIKVSGGTINAQPQVSSAAANAVEEEQPAARTDIVHIKMDPGTLGTIGPSLVRQPIFLLAQAIPVAAVIGLTVWRRRQDRIAANPKLRRKMEVRELVRRGLMDLRHFASNNDAEQFYATLFRLLQEQIGERVDLPASAITEAVLDDRLRKRGASRNLIERLHHLFQIANQARYAPTRTDAELLSLCSDLEKAVGELQQLPD